MKINWNNVVDALCVPLVFAVCYVAGEAGTIAAIALGASDKYNLLKIGWVIGLLCGAVGLVVGGFIWIHTHFMRP